MSLDRDREPVEVDYVTNAGAFKVMVTRYIVHKDGRLSYMVRNGDLYVVGPRGWRKAKP